MPSGGTSVFDFDGNKLKVIPGSGKSVSKVSKQSNIVAIVLEQAGVYHLTVYKKMGDELSLIYDIPHPEFSIAPFIVNVDVSDDGKLVMLIGGNNEKNILYMYIYSVDNEKPLYTWQNQEKKGFNIYLYDPVMSTDGSKLGFIRKVDKTAEFGSNKEELYWGFFIFEIKDGDLSNIYSEDHIYQIMDLSFSNNGLWFARTEFPYSFNIYKYDKGNYSVAFRHSLAPILTFFTSIDDSGNTIIAATEHIKVSDNNRDDLFSIEYGNVIVYPHNPIIYYYQVDKMIWMYNYSTPFIGNSQDVPESLEFANRADLKYFLVVSLGNGDISGGVPQIRVFDATKGGDAVYTETTNGQGMGGDIVNDNGVLSFIGSSRTKYGMCQDGKAYFEQEKL